MLNIWDAVILGIIGGGAALALRHIGKKKGNGCTGNCASCGCVCNERERGR